MTVKALGNIIDIGSAFSPVDFNTSDAATGARVDMRHAGGIMCVLFKGAGTAGADPNILYGLREKRLPSRRVNFLNGYGA